MVAPNAGSIRLAGEHFAAATLYLVIGSIALVTVAPALAAGNFAAPHVAGFTHLFTLGFLTTTIFGALYQLLPVALAAPLRWPKLGHVSFWTFAPGVALFATGVATSNMILNPAGIVLLTTGIVLAVVNLGFSLPRSRSRDITWTAVALALTFLFATLVLGVVLLHNLHTGFIAAARVRVLATHLHVALVGWALMMIVGVSHRLLPMFLLAHGARNRWTHRAVGFLAIGVPVLGTGILMQVPVLSWAGVLALELGIGCFLWQVRSFYQARIRKNIDIGMRFAGTALAFLTIAAVLGPFVMIAGPGNGRIGTAYVLVGLLGGIILYVVGFFYKIVPLLAWTARYSGRMGREALPTTAEMYSQRLARLQLLLMAVGVALLGAGAGFGIGAGTMIGSILFLGGVLVFATQIARVAFGGKR